MSKFSSLMHLLDVEHPEIKDREFPQNLRPYYKQMVALIKLRLPELNTLCAKCMFCDVISTQGKIDELGIGGYMSNQPDGLKPVRHSPTTGVTLREPTTIIIGQGQAFACRNRMNKGPFFLTEQLPSCDLFKEKVAKEPGK